MLRVVGEQPGPDREVDGEGGQGAERREGERPLARPSRLDGEDPLHQVVVGAEGGGGAHEAAEHGEPDDVRVGEHAAPEIRVARGRPPVDHPHPPGLRRRPVEAGEPAVHLAGEKQHGEGAGHEEGDRLEDVGPDHGLHATERDVGDRYRREEGEGGQEGPADQDRHREGGRHQADARPEEPRDEEEHGAGRLARLAEAVMQELVDRGAVVPVERRDEQERHEELGQALAHEELGVLPVLAVGGGREPR